MANDGWELFDSEMDITSYNKGGLVLLFRKPK